MISIIAKIVAVTVNGMHADKGIIACEEDLESVSKHTWRLYTGHPHCNTINITLQHLILGPRPEVVPVDYVIDHIDRNPLNASCSDGSVHLGTVPW